MSDAGTSNEPWVLLGTGNGILEYLKYSLGSWKLLGSESPPPSFLPFFSTEGYRNSSTEDQAQLDFFERLIFFTFLKAQLIILINASGGTLDIKKNEDYGKYHSEAGISCHIYTSK